MAELQTPEVPQTEDVSETIEDTATRLERLFADFSTHGAPSASTAATFLIKLTGTSAGAHLLSLGPEGATWQHDVDDSVEADATVKMEADDVVAVMDGKLDGRLAVASERIELEGDLDIARQMLAMVTPLDEISGEAPRATEAEPA